MELFYRLLDELRILVQNNFWLTPLIGVFLPFIEAILPTIPLAIIISFNLSVLGSAFGTVQGTILTIFLSTLGSFLGMFLIYLLIKATFAEYFVKKIRKYKYGNTFIDAIQGRSTFFILTLLSNPFLPSSILNYGLSLANIKIKKYLILTIISRFIIIIFMVFLGSVFSIQKNPLNVLWMMLAYFFVLGIWILYLRSRKNKKGSFFEDKD
ncbi:MAG: TVP38/TMEM64 family protein [Candidatus Izemoplasmatales bacterium]